MGTGVFQRLPPELAENVLSSVDFPITLEEAREQRLELMEERKNFCYHADDLIESKTFSVSPFSSQDGRRPETYFDKLCEH